MVDKDLSYLMEEHIKRDYSKRDNKFEFPGDAYKNLIYQVKLDKHEISKDTKIVLFLLGKAITNALNKIGYHKWLPDFVKDTAIKLLLQYLIDDQWLIASIEKKTTGGGNEKE